MEDSTYNFVIREINKNDLDKVAAIHISAFPESLLTSLNFKTIKRYYGWQMTPPNICYAIGIFDFDELIGFCFSGSMRNAEIYFLQDNLLFFFINFLLHPKLLFHPKLVSRYTYFLQNLKAHFIQGKWRRNKQQQVKRHRFGILSIAVASGFQRIGIGKKLMDNVELHAKSQGYTKIELSVHPDNQNAVNFYNKHGWEKVSLEPGQTWQGQMEKSIR